MKRSLSITSTLIAGIAVAVFACDSQAPTAVDTDDVLDTYEALQDILGSDYTESTARRINILLGRPADAPTSVAFVDAASLPGERLTFTTTIAADDDGGPDPECSFMNGQTVEELEEFVRCQNEHPDCRVENQLRRYTDEDGEERVDIVGVHIHCDDDPH